MFTIRAGVVMENRLRVRDVEFPPMRQQPRSIPRPPDFGAISTPDPRPAVVARSDEEILNGFVGQQLRLQVGPHLLCVTASQGVDVAFPFEHPVVIASTSVKGYRDWPVPADLEVLPAIALAADRQWIDRMVVMPDGPQFHETARSFGGKYALLWSAMGMAVVDLATERIVRSFATRTREMVYRCCPLIQDAQPGDRCRMYGGGSISQAIVAAGYWLDRRFLFLEELGCDEPCGVASHREDPRVPTRYLKWMTAREITAQWDGIVNLAQAEPEL